MNKNKWLFSPFLRIVFASSILLGHIILGLILFCLQESITCRNTEKILVSGIAGVRKSLSVAESAINAPEYAYLFTEYDIVGENGGFIISDSLHDIRCGKRIESCRTLEDAGIDINKYEPLSINEVDIFGVPCHFAYLREESYVIVAYIPVEEQKAVRNMNIFSALGSSLIVFIVLFFLVPILLRFLSRFPWFSSVLADNESVSACSRDADESLGNTSVDMNGARPTSVSTENVSSDENGESDYVSSVNYAEHTVLSDVNSPDTNISDVYNENDEAETNNIDISGITEYVEKMEELKKTAYRLGEEKLFKMTAYLEKCGRAILSGSKNTDKFMAEIDSKTPVALKYYASCCPEQAHPVLEPQITVMTEPAKEKEIETATVSESVLEEKTNEKDSNEVGTNLSTENLNTPDLSATNEYSSENVVSNGAAEEVAAKPEIAEKNESAAVSIDEKSATGKDALQYAEKEPEPELKADVSPAEIFAVLEALYAGAGAADESAVDTQISALRRINLPRKLNAVFPELAHAAVQNDYSRIKTVINSLRTRNRSA